MRQRIAGSDLGAQVDGALQHLRIEGGANHGPLQVEVRLRFCSPRRLHPGLGAAQLGPAQHQRLVLRLQGFLQFAVFTARLGLTTLFDFQFRDGLLEFTLPLQQRVAVVGILDAQQDLATAHKTAGDELPGQFDPPPAHLGSQFDVASGFHHAQDLDHGTEGAGFRRHHIHRHGGLPHGRFALGPRLGGINDAQRGGSRQRQDGADRQGGTPAEPCGRLLGMIFCHCLSGLRCIHQ